jgi:hypothetical protein
LTYLIYLFFYNPPKRVKLAFLTAEPRKQVEKKPGSHRFFEEIGDLTLLRGGDMMPNGVKCMSKSKIAEEFPLLESEQEKLEDSAPEPTESSSVEPLVSIQAESDTTEKRPVRIGSVEGVVRVATHLLSIVLVVLIVWVMRNFYLQAIQTQPAPQNAAQAAPLPTAMPTAVQLILPAFGGASESPATDGVPRYALLHTTIPTRARVDVITYTVQQGDNLFGIADNFGLEPETILWGNYHVLEDNPHVLRPDQVLNILPLNGTYHLWHEGESLPKVAEFYQIAPEAIVDYPGNRLDPVAFNIDNPTIEPGTWLIVPGGRRAIQDWGPPAISRSNPARASYYGPGACGEVYSGAVGNGTFVWPTTSRGISGYGYNPPIHPAIDIAGSIGNAIYATDSGVVVYAGWSNYGYGWLIVIDHGNGWQSAYAHLSAVGVFCGQSVGQGTVIGGLGNSGNSTGPHLHFELLFNGAKVNPLNFLQ